MNDPVITARVLMCLLAVVPSVVGYYWVQYYDRFPPKSLGKFGLMLLVMFLYSGSLFLQFYVYRIVGHMAKGDLFFSILIIVEYFFASVVIFVSLAKRKRAKHGEG